MKKTLISLVSDQTIPNVLLLMQRSFNRYIFVATNKTDKLVKPILKAAVLEDAPYETILVDAEDMSAITDVLNKDLHFDDNEHVTVNITGGTKIMVIAIMLYVQERKQDSLYYYLPLNRQKYDCIFGDGEHIAVEKKVNLKQYLDAYAVKLSTPATLPDAHLLRVAHESFMSQLRRGKNLQEIINSKPTSDKNFNNGGWFEYWVYDFVKRHFKLSDGEIGINLKLSRVGSDLNNYTEYDVVFVRNNKLFVIECKAFSSDYIKDKVNKDWYKLASIRNQLGLTVTSCFVICNRLSDIQKKSLDDAAGVNNIKRVIDFNELKDDALFGAMLNEFVK